MSTFARLALWAIPYSAAWSFKLATGIDLKDKFPAMARPANKTEAALQHTIAVSALAATSLAFGPISLVAAAIVAAVKIRNLWHYPIN